MDKKGNKNKISKVSSKARKAHLNEIRNSKRKSQNEARDVSASKRKLEMYGSEAELASASKQPDAEKQQQQWILAHIDQLNNMFSKVLCPVCSQTSLKMSIEGNRGYAAELAVSCQRCDYRVLQYSSPCVQTVPEEKEPAFEITTRMTLAAHEMGLGFAALGKFSTVLGIPGVGEMTYRRHQKRVSEAETEALEKISSTSTYL